MSAVHDRWELVEPLVFAYPLRCCAAFEKGVETTIESDVLRDLRREHRFDDSSIARALQLRGGAWRQERESLHQVIRAGSTRWLVADGSHWSLRVEPGRVGHEIIRWRALTMLIPSSIVIAGAMSETGRARPLSVQTLPTSIAPQGRVGHLHVHLGPMLPFEALWMNLWGAYLVRGTLDSPKGGGIDTIRGEALPDIAAGGSKRQPGLRWQWTLELAFMARVWLLEMIDGSTVPIPPALAAFSRGNVDAGRRAKTLLSFWASGPLRARARKEAREFAEARLQSERRELRAAQALGRVAEAGEPAREADDEIALMARALRCCQSPGSRAELHAQLFYQYLRVKVALYGRLVVDPWTTGLRHFLDVVRRDKEYDNVIGRGSALEAARLTAARDERPLNVGALEIHIAPESFVRRPRTRHPRHAWVLSFVRAERPTEERSDGTEGASGWKRQANRVGAMCRFLSRCIADRPSLLREVRGLSLMDWERCGPVWLFERHFRGLVEASVRVAAEHPRLRLHPLRTAMHLGEDYDHILSGLRQIYEPFAWGLIARGDRIGHALALGQAGTTWCASNPRIRMRPLDRILDIGFVYFAFSELGIALGADSMERLRFDAGRALGIVFGQPGAARAEHEPPTDSLREARDLWLALAHKVPSQSRVSYGELHGARWRRRRLLEDPLVGRLALSPSLSVETASDLPVIEAVHRLVHDRVAEMQVAIEVNPSSNLLVGGFRSIFEQPVFHLDHLPMTLNADDPLTFATTLADDYAYAWAAMVLQRHVTPHAATMRLEEAARCSMRYAFNDLAGEDGLLGDPR